MKDVKIGELTIKVCECQADINYLRFVKFKQYAPQFWEKMDSPLFAVYFEKFMHHHNKSEHGQALMVLHDYKLAIDMSKNSFDAWGICFALITVFADEDERSCPDELQLRHKLETLTAQGLTAETVKAEVVNFMQASPEVFGDHLIMLGMQRLMSATTNG